METVISTQLVCSPGCYFLGNGYGGVKCGSASLRD